MFLSACSIDGIVLLGGQFAFLKFFIDHRGRRDQTTSPAQSASMNMLYRQLAELREFFYRKCRMSTASRLKMPRTTTRRFPSVERSNPITS